MRISDWSSDFCSSDLLEILVAIFAAHRDAQVLHEIDVERPVEVEIDHRLPRRHAAGVEPLWAIRAADRGVEAVDHPVIELVRSVDDRQVGVPDRKSVVEGKSVSVRVDLGGRRLIKKKMKIISAMQQAV